MTTFGKCGAATPQYKRPATLSHAPQARPATLSTQDDLITDRDRKSILKGQLPHWATVGRTQLTLFVVIFPLIISALCWFYGPELLRDHLYSGTYQVAKDVHAEKGKCTRHAFLVTLCSVAVHSARTGQPVYYSKFFMLFKSAGGQAMIPVRSTANPEIYSIKYTVEEALTARTLSFGVAVLFLMWMTSLFLGNLLKGRHKGGAGHHAALQYAQMKLQNA